MKFSFSSLAILIVALVCLLVDFSLKNWEKEERVIEWDVHSYYEYLPALFIYDDIKFEKSDYRIGDHRHLFWPVFTDDGKKVIKMTMGTAFLYAPFFAAAHLYAGVTDYPEDGFSEPYKLFLLFSTVFYLIIGFNFLKKILTYYDFSDKVIAAVILLIGLGTNMLCYASQSAPMTHVYSFCLFSIFIFFTIKWYQDQSVRNTLALGLLLGLISLIRPSNAVVILFFILYGISTVPELKQRITLFFSKYILLLAMAFLTILVWAPQIIYWKYVTGHFFSYSYGEEGFFFLRPRILEGLFSWRKGWLVYTPMMTFALIGIYFLRGELKKLRLPIIVFMVANIYIIFSWWCWWYGGTLGQRSFIESYSLLAIPFAAFIQHFSNFPSRLRAPLWGGGGAVALFLIWLNVFQTYQFEFHALHYDSMSKQLYFEQFGKLDTIPDSNPHIRGANYRAAMKGMDCETPAWANLEDNQPPVNIAAGKTELSRRTIQLKAFNGKYVCADESAGNIVIANRDTALGWETFTLVIFENRECALLSSNNKYFSVLLEKQNAIAAVQVNAGKQEVFLMEEPDKGRITFKAPNGKYLGVDEVSLQLHAGSTSIGKQEKFELISQ